MRGKMELGEQVKGEWHIYGEKNTKHLRRKKYKKKHIQSNVYEHRTAV